MIWGFVCITFLSIYKTNSVCDQDCVVMQKRKPCLGARCFNVYALMASTGACKVMIRHRAHQSCHMSLENRVNHYMWMPLPRESYEPGESLLVCAVYLL
jgi:hypothetical protein